MSRKPKTIRVLDPTKGQHPDGKCWKRAPLPPKGNGMALCGLKWKHKGPHAWAKSKPLRRA